MSSNKSFNEEKNKQIKDLQKELHIKEEKIQETLVKLDSIEQMKYDKDIQLVGLPESTDEDGDLEKVLTLAKERMEQTIPENEIENVFRL